GIQTTDANGQVTFTTIVPGCYNGRYPHIHFEVFSSLTNATTGRYAVLVSQFAVPKDVLTSIYASDTRYTSSIAALNNTSISSDNVFGDNTSAQIDAMTMEMSGSIAAGYTATATVGIAT
ncbi:MAG: intradiol ring-cleavage dioxygenase, partial [Sphingomonadaceae bacterium]|nr:intradiol ring-cleavage dioxygenase [Sphingomonadaceae bacterium]